MHTIKNPVALLLKSCIQCKQKIIIIDRTNKQIAYQFESTWSAQQLMASQMLMQLSHLCCSMAYSNHHSAKKWNESEPLSILQVMCLSFFRYVLFQRLGVLALLLQRILLHKQNCPHTYLAFHWHSLRWFSCSLVYTSEWFC